MTDNGPLVPDASAVRRYGSWEEEAKDRAKDLYLGPANLSATRTEWMLLREAQESTPDGGVVPAVPAARTIRDWAATEGWNRERYAYLAENLGETATRINVKMAANVEAAVDAYADILFTDKYDANPAVGLMKQKAADAVLKVWGKGTYGANQGGELTLRIDELLPQEALDDRHGGETPMETAARLREEALEAKRGTR